MEAIIALPLNMFYNTNIATFMWVLTNRKPEHRRGKVQLIDATNWFRQLRMNLGKKNCELGEADIERICRTFLEFEETEQSKIFVNDAFGYWKVTVERPLRLAVDLSEQRYQLFFNACIVADDVVLGEAVHGLSDRIGADLHLNFNHCLEEVKAELLICSIKLTVKRKRLMRTALAERHEAAMSVAKTIHRRDAVAHPIQGLFKVGQGARQHVVEYEPDTELRQSEQIPLQQDYGIEGFLRRKVLPYAPDAWYVLSGVTIGYEINFNQYFYKVEPMRRIKEIRSDILDLERAANRLLQEIMSL